MSDLDAMEHNGKTHNGESTTNHTGLDADEGDDCPGEDELWDELDTL